ncbi:MAG: phage head morphogenesis protein [Lachnospiraceae bacterium]|nr:phage head morphogenesis protein [Lachnospiraceae bacterium]
MNLDELLAVFALTNNQAEQSEIMEKILDYFVEVMNIRRSTVMNQLGLVFNQSYSSRFNAPHRYYVAGLLIGFRDRMQDYAGTVAESELIERLAWESERLIYGETRNSDLQGEHDAYLWFQEVNPQYMLTKTWVAIIDSKTCHTCAWLNGTTIPIDQLFLLAGQPIINGRGGEGVYSYIDRQVSIAHPNCRCNVKINVERR